MYLLVYRLGIKRAYRPSCKVLCIGNFTAGGTGKTPTVAFVASCLKTLGVPFVIGCSGYGAPHSEGATVAPEGRLTPSEWGDEPAEFREMLPEIPLIVGRGRVAAAKLAETHFPGSVLLMDDGFQHMPLARDISIILDPATPNRLTFPAGPYREPQSAGRRRADLVIPSSTFSLQFSPLRFANEQGEFIQPPSKARIITAIGRPDKFRIAVESSGVTIDEFVALPDHDPMIVDLGGNGKEFPWIVTQKDWVKLRDVGNTSSSSIIVALRVATIEPADEFQKWLKMKLG